MTQRSELPATEVGERVCKALANLPSVLSSMGYKELRKGQDTVIMNMFKGKDTICILPTSGGKSATYQIPTMCLGLRTVIISPLIALMKDQMESMLHKRIRADQISSGQSAHENRNALMMWSSESIQCLLVSPERIDNEEFIKVMKKHPPDLVVVDEAHCVYQWSNSFRPQYRLIGEKFINEVNPRTVLALTATCTSDIEVSIRECLCMHNADKLVYIYKRDNLHNSVVHIRNQDDGLMKLVKILKQEKGNPTIVYCSTVATVELLFNRLKQFGFENSVGMYHGKMDPSLRNTVQNSFLKDQLTILVATNAFGMGIDKPNVRNVIHFNVPGTMEALAQESGRAGRDGLDSKCILLYNSSDVDTQEWFIENTYPEVHFVELVYNTMLELESTGQSQYTIANLAEYARIDVNKAQACSNLLISHSIIERVSADTSHVTVTFASAGLRALETTPTAMFKKYADAIKTIGTYSKNNKNEFSIQVDLLAKTLSLGEATVKTRLKTFQNEGLIIYTPAPSGKVTRVMQSFDKFDAAGLKTTRLRAFTKLDTIKAYAAMPEEQLGDFIVSYFKHINEVE